jgi:hypothetical protein
MNRVDPRMLERVRKLLARAEHPATPPAEAQACSTKAAALMSRHVIDQALLEATRPEQSTPLTRVILLPAPYSLPKAALLNVVAQPFGVCVAISPDRSSGDGRRATMVGFAADLDTTELLFTSLLLQASTAMTKASRLQRRDDIRAFRRAFLLGYAGSIGARLCAVRAEAEVEATTRAAGAELVLADRSARVQAAFAEQFPRLSHLRTTASHGSGLRAGHIAGQRANLSGASRGIAASRTELAG